MALGRKFGSAFVQPDRVTISVHVACTSFNRLRRIECTVDRFISGDSSIVDLVSVRSFAVNGNIGSGPWIDPESFDAVGYLVDLSRFTDERKPQKPLTPCPVSGE